MIQECLLLMKKQSRPRQKGKHIHMKTSCADKSECMWRENKTYLSNTVDWLDLGSFQEHVIYEITISSQKKAE